MAVAAAAAGLDVAPPSPSARGPATMLFLLTAASADLDTASNLLTLHRVAPSLLWTADGPPRRAGRVRTALWANASLWTDGDSDAATTPATWLASPPAVLEGRVKDGAHSAAAALPVRVSAPRLKGDTLALTATRLDADSPAVLERGVAATALDGVGGPAASAPAANNTPLPTRLTLTDVVLYIDAAPPRTPPAAGAKQSGWWGCTGVLLGTLSSFGNNCGFYDASQFGGAQLGWGSPLGGGMTLGSGAFG